MSFANTFPAAAPASAHWSDRVVKQGHVEYCAEHGHASWTVDGVTVPRCPRCGESTAPVTFESIPTVAVRAHEGTAVNATNAVLNLVGAHAYGSIFPVSGDVLARVRSQLRPTAPTAPYMHTGFEAGAL